MDYFERIIGYDAIKEELRRIVDVLNNPDRYKQLGVRIPAGLLIHGIPGVGKTLIAQCFCEAVDGRKVIWLRKDIPDGEFVKAIKEVFAEAIENTPSIIVFDDMDKFTGGEYLMGAAEEYVALQAGIDEAKGKDVFVVGTANELDYLPSSLIRAGRFDRTIEVEAPRGKDAEKIVEHYLEDKTMAASLDAKFIARIMDGQSCASLERLINEAGLLAGYEKKPYIAMSDFIGACMRTDFKVPLTELYKNKNEEKQKAGASDLLKRIAYHEAGHAAMHEALFPGSVTLVSIQGIDSGQGGFTAYYRDEHVDARKWFEARIMCALAGRAAVEIKFGDGHFGASKDLNIAFSLVWKQVVDECSKGFALHSEGNDDSISLRSRQEEAVALEVEKYYVKAKTILEANRSFLESVAESLLREQTITSETITDIKFMSPLEWEQKG